METAVQRLLIAIDRIRETNEEILERAKEMKESMGDGMPSEAASQEYLMFLAATGGKLEILNAQMYEAADEVRAQLADS